MWKDIPLTTGISAVLVAVELVIIIFQLRAASQSRRDRREELEDVYSGLMTIKKDCDSLRQEHKEDITPELAVHLKSIVATEAKMRQSIASTFANQYLDRPRVIHPDTQRGSKHLSGLGPWYRRWGHNAGEFCGAFMQRYRAPD